MRRVLLLAVVLVLTLGAVLPAAAQGVTFTFGTFGNPVALDPSIVTDGVSFRVTTQGCEALLEFNGSTTEVMPGLAQSWEASEDGLVWTFQLVENATFHGGEPFNAEAVVWNFERWRFTDNPARLDEDVYEYYEYMFGGFDDEGFVDTVEATGEFEVTFTLKEPNGGFLNTLAMPMFAIANPATVEEIVAARKEAIANDVAEDELPPAYGSPRVGYDCTGPYSFVEWLPDDRTVLELNADYWGEIPGNIDTVIFQVIPDNAARFAALQSGQIDAFEQPNVEDLDTIDASEDLYVEMRPPLNVMYLAFNYRIAEFRDPLVREAISKAMDRAAIAEAFYPPGAIPASNNMPPSLWGHNADIAVEEYDMEGAKALLAEAGYPDGISEVSVLGLNDDGTVSDEVVETIPVRLYFQPVARPYNPDGEAIGEAQISFLADIGIQAELASAGDWSAYLDARRNGELLGMYQLGWTGDNGDPDNFIGYFFGGVDVPLAREGFYQNEELASILQQARALSAQADRLPLYEEAEAVLAADYGRLFIVHTGVPLAFRSCISGYVVNPVATEHYKFVTSECGG